MELYQNKASIIEDPYSFAISSGTNSGNVMRYAKSSGGQDEVIESTANQVLNNSVQGPEQAAKAKLAGLNSNTINNGKRYLDLDSTYRNRKLYPNPCDYTVDINAQTRDAPEVALDPIILAFPYEANLTQALSTPTQIPLSVVSSNIRNFYQGSYLEINGNFRLITFYDNLIQVATVATPFPAAYPPLTPYTIRKQVPFETGFVTSAAAINTIQIYLSAGASSVDNFYRNYYVFLPGLTPPSSYQYSRITQYNGTTKLATVATAFLAPVGAGVPYEILEFTRDNVVPLKYSGNQVVTNPIPQNITLIYLNIPNRYIKNGYGGTLSDYSYVYVALYSGNAKTSNYSIYSNNPNSPLALFKVPISFLRQNQFLTLSFTGMTQTIAFRENDSLRFSVLLPNGNVLGFEPFNKDTYFNDYIGQFPIESDPIEQVTALFELSKIVPQ